MSIIPTKENDKTNAVIGDLVETAYQVGRASQGKSYKPMGQEEVIEPIGGWVGKVLGSKTNRGRGE